MGTASPHSPTTMRPASLRTDGKTALNVKSVAILARAGGLAFCGRHGLAFACWSETGYCVSRLLRQLSSASYSTAVEVANPRAWACAWFYQARDALPPTPSTPPGSVRCKHSRGALLTTCRQGTEGERHGLLRKGPQVIVRGGKDRTEICRRRCPWDSYLTRVGWFLSLSFRSPAAHGVKAPCQAYACISP